MWYSPRRRHWYWPPASRSPSSAATLRSVVMAPRIVRDDVEADALDARRRPL
jgi:hypothetical protein